MDYDNTTDLSFNRINTNDSLYSFHLDTTLTSSWLQNFADSSLASNYGILVSPDTIITTQKVLGFTAFNINGVNDPRLKIVVQKPGAYIDTLLGYISTDISVVLGEVPNVGAENLAIQSSLTSEAKLIFDLSVIPKDVVINSATLTLTVDTVATKVGSSFTNKLSVYLLDDSTTNKLNTNFLYSLERKGATFTGSITNILRAWNNDLDNQGLLIKSTSEFWGVDIFVIRGSNAILNEQRPKLEIVYSRGKKN